MEGEKRRRCGHVAQEIVEEILVKLPVKSLVRFKAVSREWRGTIEYSYFIEKHVRYQKYLQGKQLRIVAISRETGYNGLSLENMLVSANGIARLSPYLPIRVLNKSDRFKISEPCDGLFCIYTITHILNLVNPATTSHRRLPNPTSTISYGRNMYDTLIGIGRENSESPRYKLVWIFQCGCNKRFNNESTRCMVLALDSNTWRNVDPPHYGEVQYGHPFIHLDGLLYCFTNKTHVEPVRKVLAFDLHSETFQCYAITPDIGSRSLTMRVLNHRLCIFNRFLDDHNNDLVFKIWALHLDKASWEIMYSIDLSCFPPEFKESKIIPMAVINNNYVVISNINRNILVYGSKNRIVHHTFSSSYFRFINSYIETLVSTYQ